MDASKSKKFRTIAVALFAGAVLSGNTLRAEEQALSGGEQSVLDQEQTAVEATSAQTIEPLPVLTCKPFPVKKDKFHRFTGLRGGSLKCARGWNMADWAWQALNTSGKPIEITWKLIADDPNFEYTDGSKGTFTKVMKAGALNIANGNVLDNTKGKKFPVPLESNWTGSSEWSANEPFYLYILTQLPTVEGADAQRALYKAWLLWNDQTEVLWDEALKGFVVAYANYWHNIGTWCGGWHTRVAMVNRSDKKVTYRCGFRAFYGHLNTFTAPLIKHVFGPETIVVELKPGEKADFYLEDMFGWQKDWCSRMEGWLVMTPDQPEAAKTTEIKCYQLPNKVTVDAPCNSKWGKSLKAMERNELSAEAGVVVNELNGAPQVIPHPSGLSK